MFINDNILALITPYMNTEIDYNSFQNYIRYIEKETPYTRALILGSTGDQHAISTEDKCKIFKFIHNIKTPIKFIYGVSSTNTANTLKLIDYLNNLNVNSIMLGIPPYILPNQSEIINYVETISVRTNASILLYNNYLRTGVNIDTDSMNYLIEKHSNIKGIKEAGLNTDISKINSKYIYTGSDLNMIKGDFYDSTSVIGNILPYTASIFSQKISEVITEDLINQYKYILKELSLLGYGKCIRYSLYKKTIISSKETMLPILPLNEIESEQFNRLDILIENLEKISFKLFQNFYIRSVPNE